MQDAYQTTNPEALKHEMREKTDRKLRSIRDKNAPGTTLHAIHGPAASARHRAAYFELQARK